MLPPSVGLKLENSEPLAANPLLVPVGAAAAAPAGPVLLLLLFVAVVVLVPIAVPAVALVVTGTAAVLVAGSWPLAWAPSSPFTRFAGASAA